jgi:hypothetical protein
MVYACAYCTLKQYGDVKRYGFVDSKTLSSAEREVCAFSLRLSVCLTRRFSLPLLSPSSLSPLFAFIAPIHLGPTQQVNQLELRRL